ncbi:MAG: hypothetical protein U0031_21440 [Thermomicrobiales bacterium]
MREFASIIASEEIPVNEAPVVHGPLDAWDDDDVIDGVLRLVADHHREVGAAIGRRSFSPSQAELRQSPLGLDLRVLAMAASGDLDKDLVRESAARVTDLLLRPLAAEGMVIPAWFWTSAIGRIVARASRGTYANDGLISVPEAAARLDVDPEDVRAWIADGSITSIPDEAGRPQVPRDEVEHRRTLARDLSGWRVQAPSGEDVLVREQRLAS